MKNTLIMKTTAVTRSGGALLVADGSNTEHPPVLDIVPNRKQIRDYRRSLRQRCDANKVRKG